MAKIQIDGASYETDALSDQAKAQLASLQFCDAELQRLQAEMMSIQTARIAYANALRSELDQMASGTLTKNTSKPSNNEGDKKKGFFGGLFGK